MISQRHNPANPPSGYLAALCWCWLGIAVTMLAVNAVNIWALHFPDPDDQLRLVQVRDLLAGQGWFDLRQHRIDAIDGGVPMHWSRLVDLPLVMTIGLLKPLFGQQIAELIALVGVPLMTLGCALALAMRLAWQRLGRDVALYCALAFALCVPTIEQLRPMRIDHHGWQIVLLLAAVSGLAARSARRGAMVMGLCLAALISISIEGLPMAAAVTGIAALRWLSRRDCGDLIAYTLVWLAAGSVGFFLATRGLADSALHCDAIAPQHLLALVWAAVCVGVMRAAQLRRPLTIAAGLIVAAGGALAIVLTIAPHCSGGAFATLDPLVRKVWLERINEGLPLWEQGLGYALQILAMPLIGLWGIVGLVRVSPGKERQWWIEYGLLLAAALAIACLVARAGAAAGALAAIPAGWRLRRVFASIRTVSSPLRQIGAYVFVGAALLPSALVSALALVAPSLGNTIFTVNGHEQVLTEAEMERCRKSPVPNVLRQQAATTVLAPMDLGPAILVETPHAIVASGHHRGSTAMRQVVDAYTEDSARARTIVQRHRIGIVLACTGQPEFEMYRHMAPAGFAAALADGRVPDWLEPLPVPGDSPFRLWRVLR